MRIPIRFIRVLISLGITVPVMAQESTLDTTVSLRPVEIRAGRLYVGTSRTTWQLDTLQREIQRTGSLGDVLAAAGTWYIKNYGPGRLATSSARGGAAAHTAVLWNGFNIASPLLGQVDLSLLPVAFASEVIVENGGGSAGWGSGAIGGIIHWQSRPQFTPGWEAGVQLSRGSFGQHQEMVQLQRSSEHWSGGLRVLQQGGDFDFPYTDLFGENRRQTNARYRQRGILSEQHWQGKGQRWSWNSWYQSADRQIPPTWSQASSQARQVDAAWRNTLEYRHDRGRLPWQVRAAWFDETLHYTDSVARLDSRSRGTSLITEGIVAWPVNPSWRFQVGIYQAWLRGEADNYARIEQEYRRALWGEASGLSRDGHWQGKITLRQEWAPGITGPLTPDLQLTYQPSVRQQYWVTLQQNYRIPTFNDRYWLPGGNPELLPEQGWGQEIGVRLNSRVKNGWSWKSRQTIFHRRVRNWISWVPQGGEIWSPENIQRVRSYGLEVQPTLFWVRNSFRMGIEGQYSWVRSRNDLRRSVTDPAWQKQLIYVPEHQASLQVSAQHHGWKLAYQQRWLGQVYTLPDHSEGLPAFTTADIFLQYTLAQKQASWQCWLRVGNVWGADYQVVTGRPMPGRSGEIGIQFSRKAKR
ncbi:MAG: TonB-dependent receptor plug domain-containing protein [Lewinellaceae bacterium]|nr:TonB-dependent receptor plug domain-containing protein [Lewinellaceae bacterium]